jgi:hypothetical protein
VLFIDGNQGILQQAGNKLSYFICSISAVCKLLQAVADFALSIAPVGNN